MHIYVALLAEEVVPNTYALSTLQAVGRVAAWRWYLRLNITRCFYSELRNVHTGGSVLITGTVYQYACSAPPVAPLRPIGHTSNHVDFSAPLYFLPLESKYLPRSPVLVYYSLNWTDHLLHNTQQTKLQFGMFLDSNKKNKRFWTLN